jgi:hypothetical protein
MRIELLNARHAASFHLEFLYHFNFRCFTIGAKKLRSIATRCRLGHYHYWVSHFISRPTILRNSRECHRVFARGWIRFLLINNTTPLAIDAFEAREYCNSFTSYVYAYGALTIAPAHAYSRTLTLHARHRRYNHFELLGLYISYTPQEKFIICRFHTPERCTKIIRPIPFISLRQTTPLLNYI